MLAFGRVVVTHPRLLAMYALSMYGETASAPDIQVLHQVVVHPASTLPAECLASCA